VATLDDDDRAYLESTYARLDNTPSLADQFITACVGPYQGNFAPASAVYFFVCPTLLTVTGGWFNLYNTIPADDSNYVQISLGKRHQGNYSRIATVDSRTSWPNSPGVAWDFGKPVSWNTQAFAGADLEPGDLLGFEVRTVGSPTLPKGQAAVTVGYQLR
jgi:hypothetical protein